MRVLGRFGISNPRVFVVGDRPETAEIEPNNNPNQANSVVIGQTINGRFENELDVDCFAFIGKKDQRIVIDLEGSRIDTRVEAALKLFSPAGKLIAENQDAHHADPFLEVTLACDGRYVLKAHDVVYGGSAEHGYRLTIHAGPWIDSISPVVVEPGKTSVVTLFGRNLGGTIEPAVAIAGRPLERKVVSIKAPEASEAAASVDDFLSPAQAGRSGFTYRLEASEGASNPVFLAFATDPIVLESRPAEEPGSAQTVTPPCDISGSFAHVDEVDRYRFQAKKGETWFFEAEAERLGSPADSGFCGPPNPRQRRTTRSGRG